ncbi:hypothetical protein AcV7_009902 [Taiwanofungus camphoratus]|nr:hypothetical protein AcV7_009902 [Antrodia cinnamomea]
MYQQGKFLLREKPLFVVPVPVGNSTHWIQTLMPPPMSTSPGALLPDTLASLAPEQCNAFYNLSHVNLPLLIPPETDPYREAAGRGVGIFSRMAHLNYGCASALNVVYSW